MVWASALYMKIVVRQLNKQLVDAKAIEFIGKSRCESARKNLNIMDMFYKVVVVVLLILAVIFIADEVMRAIAFFSQPSVPELTFINANLLLGVLAFGGFWYMVRDVRNYNVALVNKCKELTQ